MSVELQAVAAPQWRSSRRVRSAVSASSESAPAQGCLLDVGVCRGRCAPDSGRLVAPPESGSTGANSGHRLDFMPPSRRPWPDDGVQCGSDRRFEVGITRGAVVGAVQKFPRSARPRMQIEDVSKDSYAVTFLRRANRDNYARTGSPITLGSIHSL